MRTTPERPNLVKAHLTDQEYDRLIRRARQLGVAMADLIRRAIEAYCAAQEK